MCLSTYLWNPLLGMTTFKNYAAVRACASAWDVQCGNHSLTKLHCCCEAPLHFEYFIRVFFLPFWLQSPSLWQPSEQQPAGGAPHPTVAALWEHPQLQVTDPQTLPPLGWCKAMLLWNLPPALENDTYWCTLPSHTQKSVVMHLHYFSVQWFEFMWLCSTELNCEGRVMITCNAEAERVWGLESFVVLAQCLWCQWSIQTVWMPAHLAHNSLKWH